MSDESKNRKTKLVKYLLKVTAQVNRKPILYIPSGYGEGNILWFSNIVDIPNCVLKDWSNTDGELLKVRRKSEPSKPPVPDICRPWIHDEDSDSQPQLKVNIFEEIESGKIEKKLSDHPEVKSTFDEYIEKWKKWKQEHDKWAKGEKCYQKLFALRQTLNKNKEQYELILGLGLLQYKNKNGLTVTRHLLVSQTELELEAERSELIVRLSSDVGNLNAEFEMLEDDINRETEDKIKELLNEDSSLSQENIDKILKTASGTLFDNGEYDPGLERVGKVTEKPVITFSPAIILRERPPIGLKKILKDIARQTEEGVKPSALFEELTSIGNKLSNTDESSENINIDAEELFFLKPYNETQKKIVDKIRYANGIVVQGPPGTGKSHTIANLICHLLATGNRVLVTAKTDTALKVLRDKIPDSLKKLVISLLGSGIAEKNLLEDSVSSILNASNNYDNETIHKKIDIITERLKQLREEKAKKDRRLEDIVKSETINQSIAEGRYKGKLSSIVRKIKEESEKYSWFKDDINQNAKYDLSTQKMSKIFEGMHDLYDARDELQKDFEKLTVSAGDFNSLVNELSTLSDSDLANLENNYLCRNLSKLSAEDLFSILRSLENLDNKRGTILSKHKEDWIKAEFDNISEGNEANYAEILDEINKCMAEVRDSEKTASDYNIECPSELTTAGIYKDAETLKKYAEEGHSLSRLNLFKPRNIRKCLYIFEKIKINGQLCQKTIDDLSILIRFANYHYNIKLIKDKLRKFVEIPEDIELQGIEKRIKILEEISEINDLFSEIKRLDIFDYITDVSISNLKDIKQACSYAVINKLKRQLQTIIDKGNAHPVIFDLLTAVKQRDTDKYRQAKVYLDNIFEKHDRFLELQDLIDEFKEKIPLTINEMEKSYKDDAWKARIVNQLEDAWHWSQAKNWIESYINRDDISEIEESLKSTEDRIRNCIEKLAQLKSWDFCITRLTRDQKEHMKLWEQALDKLGKGTGKYANKWKKIALEHFNGCQEAIPAWIMPLYNVWNNISAAPEIFDVIIVDEASQCGLEATPLFYLAKKIIIVGDDKQISPENVGLDRSTTNQFMNEYLHSFGSFKDRFDCDKSLFDIGNAVFNSSQIVLREHFRCMPEIIKFSNDLCYSHTPLIPLKQFGADRLPPLEHVFVESGFRQGKNDRVINTPEADAIVRRIEQICDDEKYNNKTIGVIVLQGRAQAELIQQRLSQELSAEEYEEHEIVCGVPSQFQGNEKDIILLSMVVAPNEPFNALTKKADQQRFNVAMSRAKEQVVLFHSVRISDLNTAGLRKRLLEFFENKNTNEVNGISKEELEKFAHQSEGKRKNINPPDSFDSWFEVDVALEIMRRGYQIQSQYEVAGKRIDIVVMGGSARLAVECDGDHWHTPDNYEDDMKRQRQLERCGWEFFRIRESAFYLDKEQSLKKLWEILESKGIKPQFNISL